MGRSKRFHYEDDGLTRRERRAKRKEERKLTEWQRSGKFNRHHIKNKCRGGTWATENILIMDTRRHAAWHFLFQNMSFREVAALLLRTSEMKHSEN